METLRRPEQRPQCRRGSGGERESVKGIAQCVVYRAGGREWLQVCEPLWYLFPNTSGFLQGKSAYSKGNSDGPQPL